MSFRLRKGGGYWFYGLWPRPYGAWIGLGKSPAEAYDDWKAGKR